MRRQYFCHVAKKYLIGAVLLFTPALIFADDLSDEQELFQEQLLELTLEDLMTLKVSVSSVKKETVFDTPSTVTVIDRLTIERFNYSSIEEALDTVAGFDVYQTIIDRNVPTARGILQNFYANKVLLLIDNIPTWQPIYGEGALERININDVEKIEVLKGPASVLYGSNAYTGVVNIVLKKQSSNSISTYGRIGTGDLLAGGISFNHQFDEFSLFGSINAESEESDTYQATSAQGRDFNGDLNFDYSNVSQKNNFNLGLTYNVHSLYVNQYNYKHSFLGIHPSYVGGGGKNVENQGTLLNYKYQNSLSEYTDIIASVTYDYFKRDFPVSYDYSSAISLAANRYVSEVKFNYHQDEINVEYGLNGEVRQSDGHNTINGITGELKRSNLKDDEDVVEWSAFARVKYDIDKLSLLVGGRYTDNQNFGENFSTRFSGVYSLEDNQSIKMIIGQSFRVPTMFELYFDHPTVKGNTELAPETSTSYELAYLYGGKKVFVQMLAYYGIYKDLIQRQVPENGPPAQYQNANDFKGYGTEIELKYEFDKTVSGYLNYNYVKGVDEQLDHNYHFVPDHTVSFGLNKHFSYFSFSAKGKYISEVEGHLDIIKPQFFISMNATIKQKFQTLSLRHVFSVDNITDSEMLTPEYIRQTANINDIPTMDFGTRYSYAIFVDF